MRDIKRQKTKAPMYPSRMMRTYVLCARPWGWNRNGTQSLCSGCLQQVNARGSGVLLNASQQDLQKKRRRRRTSSRSDCGPCCKCSHYGQFQATYMTSLKPVLGRDVPSSKPAPAHQGKEVDVCISAEPMARIEKFIGSERKAARANNDVFSLEKHWSECFYCQ